MVQTRLATRMVGDRDAYLAGPGPRAIGRRIDHEQHELFVVCGAADALALELAQSPPVDIALHELGAVQSMAVLQAAAAAAGRKVQRLAIRRQGYGDVLAQIHFVELPRSDGAGTFRVYSTAAEGAARAETERVAHTLLSHSRFGVLLAGRRRESVQAMEPLMPALDSTHWRNRTLLLLPMAGESVAPDPLWPRPNGLEWHDAPPCANAHAAWAAIAWLWNQLKLGDPIALPQASAAPAPGRAAAGSGTLNRAPAVDARADTALSTAPTGGPAAPSTDPWRARLDACAALPGFVSGCAFELDSQKTLAHAGGRPGPASLAVNGAALAAAAAASVRKLGIGGEMRTLVLSLDQHHLALIPCGGGVALHAVFDAQRLAAAVLQAALAVPRAR